jgi:hypothetical protein
MISSPLVFLRPSKSFWLPEQQGVHGLIDPAIMNQSWLAAPLIRGLPARGLSLHLDLGQIMSKHPTNCNFGSGKQGLKVYEPICSDPMDWRLTAQAKRWLNIRNLAKVKKIAHY